VDESDRNPKDSDSPKDPYLGLCVFCTDVSVLCLCDVLEFWMMEIFGRTNANRESWDGIKNMGDVLTDNQLKLSPYHFVTVSRGSWLFNRRLHMVAVRRCKNAFLH
jgi:hypothetical protein